MYYNWKNIGEYLLISKEYTLLYFNLLDNKNPNHKIIGYIFNNLSGKLLYIEFGKTESRKSRWRKMRKISDNKNFDQWLILDKLIQRNIKLKKLQYEINKKNKI